MEPTPKAKLSLTARLLLGLLLVVLAGITAVGLVRTAFKPAPPEQPIAFSHKLHAGDKQIDCQYCHTAARRSISAGLPSVERCMGCHQFIAVRRPEIRKLVDYWEKKQPVPWARIHRLPDFVYFSHKRHVAAGVRCQECHGPVETMEVVYQFASLEMGWCLSCHQQPAAEVSQRAVLAPDVARHTRAPLDCATCHK